MNNLNEQIKELAKTHTVAQLVEATGLTTKAVYMRLFNLGIKAVSLHRQLEISPEELAKLYASMDFREIAKELGCSTNNVKWWLEKHKIYKPKPVKKRAVKAKKAHPKPKAAPKLKKVKLIKAATPKRVNTEKKNAPAVSGLGQGIKPSIRPEAKIVYTENTRHIVIQPKTDDPRSMFSRPVYNPSARAITWSYAR